MYSTNKKKVKNLQKANKKALKSYLILVGIVIIIGIIIAFFALSSNTSNDSDTNHKVTSANELKSEALKLINSDSAKAKNLLQQALALYQSVNDENNVVDAESLIYLIDHKK